MDDDCVIISNILPGTAIPISRLSYDGRNCYRISFRKSYFKSKRKIIANYPVRKKGDHRSAAGCRWMRFVQQDGGGADRA